LPVTLNLKQAVTIAEIRTYKDWAILILDY
jgi:hypothetical protein